MSQDEVLIRMIGANWSHLLTITRDVLSAAAAAAEAPQEKCLGKCFPFWLCALLREGCLVFSTGFLVRFPALLTEEKGPKGFSSIGRFWREDS